MVFSLQASACPYEIKTPLHAVQIFTNAPDGTETTVYRTFDRQSRKLSDPIGIIRKKTPLDNSHNPVFGLNISYINGSDEAMLDLYELGYEELFAAYLDNVENNFFIVLPDGKAGWINLPPSGSFSYNHEGFTAGTVITRQKTFASRFSDNFSTGESFMVLKTAKNYLDVRNEQSRDMWCDDGNPPPLKPFRKKRLPLSAFYDSSCRMLITASYPRGC
ncbi:MAG: hypothetical protein V4691_03815 [Pseudomonadota bacterium]